jgi:phage gp36-like protein
LAKYSTTTSLEILLVGVTFDTATTSLVSQCITDAENEVDKYLSKRYDMADYMAMSLTALPPLLKTLTNQIAMGYYYQNSARGGKDSLDFGDKIIKRATENLILIQERKADLLNVNMEPVAEASTAGYKMVSNTTNYTPTFNVDDPLKWKQDQDQLDDADTERG